MSVTQLPEITPDDFARRFSMRAGNLMWLLGAGASASAGVPTAWDMIWDFKQRLFVSQRKVPLPIVADLSSPVVRAQLQEHIDSSAGLPPLDDPDEYAALFEAVYPSEADRRTYLDTKMVGAKPSYGHLAIATLMRGDLARIVWMTNFDSLVADGCARVYGTTAPLATVDLDRPDLAEQLINEGRWPIEVKIHGDFRSRRLKNTSDELRRQDARLRKVLVDSCRRFGLIVAGYSGRDASVMEALEEALEERAFPTGLFWLHRGDGPPLPRVSAFLERAVAEEVEAGLVRVENFDETLRDLIRLIEGIDTTELDAFAEHRTRCTAAPRLTGKRGWPVVRLNALHVEQVPTVCRLVVCQVGGYAETRDAIEKAGVDIVFTRTQAGVLAFGTDTDVRTALEPHGITDFDLHTIETKRLRYDSAVRGLLRDALTRALAQTHSLSITRRRGDVLLAPTRPEDSTWAPLKKTVGRLSGTVPNASGLGWHEGVAARLDWADDKLWLVIDPRTVFDHLSDENKAAAADFGRERSFKRYNRQLNDLIAFWEGLFGDGRELRALGIGDGVDAAFRLASPTAFSRRAHA